MKSRFARIALTLCGAVFASHAPAPTANAAPEPSDQQGREPEAKLVARGDYVAPRFSPKGNTLLVTGERLRGLVEIDTASGTTTKRSDEPRAGVHARYLADGRIAFRARRAGRLRNLVMDARGEVRENTEAPSAVFAHSDAIYLHGDGVSSTVRISTGDRFFAPVLSPDGKKVAFTGLATGIHVYDIASKKQTRIGAGTAPTWSPDSATVIFERTEDDGHVLIGSDLWTWSEARGEQRLTQTPERLERRPSFSPDGRTIAFDDNQGGVYLLPTGAAR